MVYTIQYRRHLHDKVPARTAIANQRLDEVRTQSQKKGIGHQRHFHRSEKGQNYDKKRFIGIY